MRLFNPQLKKYQQRILVVLMVIGVGVGAFLFGFGLEKAPPPSTAISDKAPLYDVTQALDDKSFWVFKSEQRLNEQEKKQAQLSEDLTAVQTALKDTKEQIPNMPLEQLQNQIIALEQKLAASSLQPPASVPIESSYSSDTQDSYSEHDNETQALFFNGHSNQQDARPDWNNNGVNSFNHSLHNKSIFSETVIAQNAQTIRPHYEHYIPAGSYAKAVLLSGVDVSVGVSAQANPQPVLLRLVHRGSLPNHFLGKMRDCRIVAAASGELSSERAQFRLEKLSCIDTQGRVIETDVDGYISGEDGKNGMRGRLVMRDVEVLKRGFLGGLLSGLGKATSQSFNKTSISPFGAINTVDSADIFKQAGSEGAGNAFELMARYNIQRAEQYQPVIQISAGREVTVIFHSGRAFGEERTKTPIRSNNELNQPSLKTLFGENNGERQWQ
jgi:conjugal transfer pilus assembly protein TraB